MAVRLDPWKRIVDVHWASDTEPTEPASEPTEPMTDAPFVFIAESVPFSGPTFTSESYQFDRRDLLPPVTQRGEVVSGDYVYPEGWRLMRVSSVRVTSISSGSVSPSVEIITQWEGDLRPELSGGDYQLYLNGSPVFNPAIDINISYSSSLRLTTWSQGTGIITPGDPAPDWIFALAAGVPYEVSLDVPTA